MRFVDEWVAVSEEEIGAALVGLLQHEGKLVEGAAACAVAALLRLRGRCRGKRVVVVCCGGNIAAATLARLLQQANLEQQQQQQQQQEVRC
jgi:threonine dehydratase